MEYYLQRCHGNYQLLDKLNVIGRTSEFARLYGMEFENVLSRGTQVLHGHPHTLTPSHPHIPILPFHSIELSPCYCGLLNRPIILQYLRVCSRGRGKEPDRQRTGGRTDMQTNRQTDRQTDRRYRQSNRRMDRWTGRQTDRKTGMQTLTRLGWVWLPQTLLTTLSIEGLS